MHIEGGVRGVRGVRGGQGGQGGSGGSGGESIKILLFFRSLHSSTLRVSSQSSPLIKKLGY